MNDAALDGWKIAQIVMGLLVGAFAWIANRLWNKVDGAVSKDDFRDTLVLLRNERDTQHKDSREERLRLHLENVANFEKLEAKLDKQAVHEVRILECERDIAAVKKYTEELKHVHVDPYTREMGILESRISSLEDKRT